VFLRLSWWEPFEGALACSVLLGPQFKHWKEFSLVAVIAASLLPKTAFSDLLCLDFGEKRTQQSLPSAPSILQNDNPEEGKSIYILYILSKKETLTFKNSFLLFCICLPKLLFLYPDPIWFFSLYCLPSLFSSFPISFLFITFTSPIFQISNLSFKYSGSFLFFSYWGYS
jgi:hypothetical protein